MQSVAAVDTLGIAHGSLILPGDTDMSNTLPAGLTLGELFTAYTADYLPTKAPKTAYQQGRLIRWLTQELGTIPLAQFSPMVVRTWKTQLLARFAPGTVRRYLDMLSTILNVAVREYEWLEHNPCRKVTFPPQSKGRTRYLSDDERQRLLAACATSRNPALPTIVLIALTTGARKGEIIGLQWAHVDFARQALRLIDTKNGESRGVPLALQAREALEVWARGRRYDYDWVFPRVDGTGPLSMDRAWRQARDRAALVNFRFHDLRHTAASYLAMSGATLRDIAEILGHKTMQMTRRYTHLTQGHTAQVVQRMADQFLAVLLGACTLVTLESMWLLL